MRGSLYTHSGVDGVEGLWNAEMVEERSKPLKWIWSARQRGLLAITMTETGGSAYLQPVRG